MGERQGAASAMAEVLGSEEMEMRHHEQVHGMLLWMRRMGERQGAVLPRPAREKIWSFAKEPARLAIVVGDVDYPSQCHVSVLSLQSGAKGLDNQFCADDLLPVRAAVRGPYSDKLVHYDLWQIDLVTAPKAFCRWRACDHEARDFGLRLPRKGDRDEFSIRAPDVRYPASLRGLR